MKKLISLAFLFSTIVVAVGCSDAKNTLVTPDADFYQKALEAKENGLPPGSPLPQAGRIKAAPPTPAA
ncbi:hypothetical protein [Roseiconus lacunae]|uniref:Lipoprotein n=1 Tax=Roseiconus lacunae TaxID=2605694 RepID=A0ABT7PRC4_9BACT|nr:hypothetical protein [Roseiconus lacunae]MCD0459198.1 hypothetical protein [Roseiconus lacunae]MDM4019010.1 hypothetical protein [Roseiconus lacunae]WRQ51814.1 hypothetical protein U8335_04565 [Stieleria sp. HD01]